MRVVLLVLSLVEALAKPWSELGAKVLFNHSKGLGALRGTLVTLAEEVGGHT